MRHEVNGARGALAALLMVLGLLGGCRSSMPAGVEPLALRVYLEARESEQALPIRLPLTGTVLGVRAKPVFTESDVLNAEVVQVDLGRCLLVQMTPAATRDLYRLTGTNQGWRLLLTGNDQALGVRVIDRAIEDGNLLIFLEVPDGELPGLVERIKATAVLVQKELARP